MMHTVLAVTEPLAGLAIMPECAQVVATAHNRLRTIVASWGQAGGLGPVVEKPGLLPPRPQAGNAAEDGVTRGGDRRPADVYLLLWDLKGPAAFDLAVTSGMRPGSLACSAQVAGARTSTPSNSVATRASSSSLWWRTPATAAGACS